VPSVTKAGLAEGVVFHIQRYSVHDGPGIRTTVFLKGCPLECAWCHNPESQPFGPTLMLYPERCGVCRACVEVCPEGGIGDPAEGLRQSERCTRCGACVEACVGEARRMAGRRMSVAEVVREAERDLLFYEESGGGVTLSGGEPVSQPEFALALLEALRARGLHTALDTCGYAPPEVFARVAAAADLVLFDVKAVDAERHRQWTGRTNEWILENLRALARGGRPARVRLPLVAGVNDSDEELAAVGRLVAECGLRNLDVLPYHRTGSAKHERLGSRAVEFEEMTGEQVAAAMERLAGFGLTVRRGG